MPDSFFVRLREMYINSYKGCKRIRILPVEGGEVDGLLEANKEFPKDLNTLF